MTNIDQPLRFSELRKRAEQLVEEQLAHIVYFSPEDTKKIIQDLRVHQIEIELQNDELKIIQTELETARRKYADLYEFSPVGLLSLDHHAQIEEANLTFATLMGMSREKLVNQPISDFIHSSSQDAYHLFFQSLRRGQNPPACEITLLPTTQIPLSVRLDGSILVQVVFQPTYRIAVTDMTEWHKVELAKASLYAAEQLARTQAERLALRLDSLQQLTAALSEAATSQQVVDVIINQGTGLLGGASLFLTLLSEDQQRLENQHLSGSVTHTIQTFQPVSAAEPTPLSDSISTQQPIWLADLQIFQTRYPHLLIDIHAQSKIQAVVCMPLRVKDHQIGGMEIRFTQPQTFNEDQKNFILAMVGQCALAVDRAQQAQKMAAVQERQWLANEFHDSVTQALFAASIIAQSMLAQWDQKPQQAKEQADTLVNLTQGALAEMRSLLIELRPEAIIRSKLHTLLNQLGMAIKGRKSLDLILDVRESEVQLPEVVHIAFYRIAQESINNVIKHSKATQLRISLHYQRQKIVLEIQDDGQGFDPQHQTAGLGQSTIRERARSIDADLRVESTPGKGTCVTLTWKSPVQVIPKQVQNQYIPAF